MSLPPRFSVPLIALLAVSSATACGSQPQSPEQEPLRSKYPLTISNCGEDLVVDEEPRSVLTIGTSAIALLDAAGASERITARAGEFGAPLPSGLSHEPTDAAIIDPADPALEAIVGAAPDIVVGHGLFAASPDDLTQVGIDNIVIEGECSHDAAVTQKTDFEAIFADVERLGQVFSTQEAAEANVHRLREELNSLTATKAPQNEGKSAAIVYYFADSAPLSARGGQGIADEVLRLAGFDNVYGDEPAAYIEPNLETLLEANPHTIVLAYGFYGESFEEARKKFLSEPGITGVEAVQQDRIVGIASSDLSPDPGALRGLRAILKGTGALPE